jgi:hypothetical protein
LRHGEYIAAFAPSYASVNRLLSHMGARYARMPSLSRRADAPTISAVGGVGMQMLRLSVSAKDTRTVGSWTAVAIAAHSALRAASVTAHAHRFWKP